MQKRWRWILAIFGGALVATTGDHLHVIYGVLDYPHPVLFRQAWWVFPLFVGATWSMISGGESVRRRLSGEPVETSLGEVVLATGAFFVAYAFTAVAAELPNVVLGVLVVLWLFRVRGMPRWVLAVGLLSALSGLAVEAGLSAAGAFWYVNPDFMGVPRWLPGLYLHAALAAIRVRGLL